MPQVIVAPLLYLTHLTNSLKAHTKENMLVIKLLLPIWICALVIGRIDGAIQKCPSETKTKYWFIYNPVTPLFLTILCGLSLIPISLQAGILLLGFGFGRWGYRRCPNNDYLKTAIQDSLRGKKITKECFKDDWRKLYEQSPFERKHSKTIYVLGNTLLSLAIAWILLGWVWDIIKWLKK